MNGESAGACKTLIASLADLCHLAIDQFRNEPALAMTSGQSGKRRALSYALKMSETTAAQSSASSCPPIATVAFGDVLAV